MIGAFENASLGLWDFHSPRIRAANVAMRGDISYLQRLNGEEVATRNRTYSLNDLSTTLVILKLITLFQPGSLPM